MASMLKTVLSTRDESRSMMMVFEARALSAAELPVVCDCKCSLHGRQTNIFEVSGGGVCFSRGV